MAKGTEIKIKTKHTPCHVFCVFAPWQSSKLPHLSPDSGAAPGLTMGRVDSKIDGHRGNSFVGASNTIRFSLNLQTDLLKISEFLSFAV